MPIGGAAFGGLNPPLEHVLVGSLTAPKEAYSMVNRGIFNVEAV